MFNRVQRFSIRKLSVGAASVIVGVSFLAIGSSQVSADTTEQAAKQEQTNTQLDATVNKDAQNDAEKVNENDQVTTSNSLVNEKDGSSSLTVSKDADLQSKIGDASLAHIHMSVSGKGKGADFIQIKQKVSETMPVDVTGKDIQVNGGKLYFAEDNDSDVNNAFTFFNFDNPSSWWTDKWKTADQITDWSKIGAALLIKDINSDEATASFEVKANPINFVNVLKPYNGIPDKAFYTSSKTADGKEHKSVLNVPYKNQVKYTIKYQLDPATLHLNHATNSDFELQEAYNGVGFSGEQISIRKDELKRSGFVFASSKSNTAGESTPNGLAQLQADGTYIINYYKAITNKSVTRTILDYNKGDDQEPVVTKQVVTFDHEVQASADGKSIVENWEINRNSAKNWAKYSALGRDGYTPDLATVTEKNVDHTTPDEMIEIHYTKEEQPNIPVVPDEPVDPEPTPQPKPEEPTPELPDIPAPLPNDVPTEPEDDTEEKTVKPHSTTSEVEKTSVKKPVAVAKKQAVNAQAAQLPQTGAEKDNAGVVGLILMSIAGLFGSVFAKNKREN